MKSGSERRTSDRRGAALALALWVLLVLGMASLQVLAAVRARVDAASFLRARTVGRYAAESGIEAARARLDDLVRGVPSSAQALVFAYLRRDVAEWGVAPIGTGRYQVVVEDLNGRIDLNRARPSVLRGLFAQFVSPGEAEELVRALRGSTALDGLPPMDEDSALPDRAALPTDVDKLDETQAADAPRDQDGSDGIALHHLEALARVPGFGDSLVAELAAYVTVGGDGLVNVNSAPPTVLASIPYVGELGARSLLAERERSGPLGSRVALYSVLSEGGAPVADARMPDLITAPRRVLVVARGWEEGHPHSHEIQAVFEVLTSSMVVGSRLRLRSWTERSR